MFIPGMPVRVQHAPANVQAPNNPAIQEIIPVPIQAVPPMAILGTALGMQDVPPADIQEVAALIVEDPG